MEYIDYLYDICLTNETLFAPIFNLLARVEDILPIYVDEENFCIEDLKYGGLYIYTHQTPVRLKILDELKPYDKMYIFDEPTFKEIDSRWKSSSIKYLTPVTCNQTLNYDNILLDIRQADFNDFDRVFKVVKDFADDMEIRDAIFYNKLWIGDVSYDYNAINFILLNPDDSIRLIYVDENYRNLGFGKELVRFIVDELYNSDIPITYIPINRKHEDIINYFTKLGFQKSETPIFITYYGGN